MINSLIKKLKSVKDTREDKGKRHPLWVILMIVIFGNMLGFHSYRALGDFTCFYQSQLCSILKIKTQSLPSFSTIRRVLISLDSQDLICIFNQWAESLVADNELDNLWFSLDGKALRNTLVNECDKMQNFVVFISLFCQKTGLVLNLEKYESKEESELKKVQKQCHTIGWKNLIISLDALHCQKETTEIITKGGNDYLIAVKKNQPSLYRKLEKTASEKQADSECIKQDNSHGRKIQRKVSVWENKETRKNSILNKFSEIKSIIKVERKGIRGKKEYEQIMYYISSRKEKAEVFLEKIREHWKIENKLHWVKDVVMEEDKSKIKHKKAASNISVLKTIGLNLFRLLEIESITQGRRWLLARGLSVLHNLE